MTAVLLSSGPGDNIQASATVIIQFFDSSDTFPRLSVLPQLVLTEAGRHWLVELPGSLPLLLLKRP